MNLSIQILREGPDVENITASTTIVPRDSALATTIDGEAVVLETESGTYYGLNEVATFVWDELDEPRSIESLRDAILEEYEVDPEQCERDLQEVVDKMASNGLVDVESEA